MRRDSRWIAKSSGGAKEQLITQPDTIETGRTYDLKVEVRGSAVRLFVDGALWGSFVDNRAPEPFAHVVTQDDSTGELLVKVVNVQDVPAATTIDLVADIGWDGKRSRLLVPLFDKDVAEVYEIK